MRNAVGAEYQSVEAALDLAVADGRAPITIADTADNTGGGAPGDSTFFLRRAARPASRRTSRSVRCTTRSRSSICQDGGLGARLRLRIGGKLGPESGAPLDVDCTVIGLSNRVVQTLNGGPSSLGACAAIRIHDRRECTRRRHRSDADRTTRAGRITGTVQRRRASTPSTKRIIVVKSMQHFHAGFAPISARVIYTGDRGALIADVRNIPYRRVSTSDFWPFNPAPDFGD